MRISFPTQQLKKNYFLYHVFEWGNEYKELMVLGLSLQQIAPAKTLVNTLKSFPNIHKRNFFAVSIELNIIHLRNSCSFQSICCLKIGWGMLARFIVTESKLRVCSLKSWVSWWYVSRLCKLFFLEKLAHTAGKIPLMPTFSTLANALNQPWDFHFDKIFRYLINFTQLQGLFIVMLLSSCISIYILTGLW